MNRWAAFDDLVAELANHDVHLGHNYLRNGVRLESQVFHVLGRGTQRRALVVVLAMDEQDAVVSWTARLEPSGELVDLAALRALRGAG